MNSERRATVLRALGNVAAPAERSSWPFFQPVRYSDPHRQFATVLRSVGGEAVECATIGEIGPLLRKTRQFEESKVVISTVPAVERGTRSLSAIEDPHELSSVDLAIVYGVFGVAENGAVWVGGEVRHRALYFIAQHLVIVLAPGTIYHNLHEAYDELRFEEPGFGTFICGPSKTADIEQSLVIGAHGARSLIVFLVRPHGMT